MDAARGAVAILLRDAMHPPFRGHLQVPITRHEPVLSCHITLLCTRGLRTEGYIKSLYYVMCGLGIRTVVLYRCPERESTPHAHGFCWWAGQGYNGGRVAGRRRAGTPRHSFRPDLPRAERVFWPVVVAETRLTPVATRSLDRESRG